MLTPNLRAVALGFAFVVQLPLLFRCAVVRINAMNEPDIVVRGKRGHLAEESIELGAAKDVGHGIDSSL